jgi:hypothetical protein
MREPVITKQMLIDAHACSKQVDLFEKTFGDSVVVTVERAEKVAIMFDWDCAARLLDATARAEYWRVKATALAERKRVNATAWASAFIDMHKRGASK